MNTAYYAEKARSQLKAKTTEQLGVLVHQMFARDASPEEIDKLMEGVEQYPERKHHLVELIMSHTAIGVLHNEKEGMEPTRPTKKGKSPLRFAPLAEKLDFGDGIKLDIMGVRTCAMCGDTPLEVKLLMCGRCNNSYYCNRECQKKHWASHRSNCQMNKL